jgi:hypothetical protein
MEIKTLSSNNKGGTVIVRGCSVCGKRVEERSNSDGQESIKVIAKGIE